MPEMQKFDAPSLSIRGALKAAMDHDYEDVIVMQTEMAWGAQEMKRYKSLKGEWPVRSSLGVSEENDSQDQNLFRGNKEPEANPEGDNIDYWNYLVSIF